MLERIDFEEDTKNLNTNDKLKMFYEILEKAVSEVFKKKEFKNKVRKSNNKIPKKIRNLMRKKNKISTKIKM